MPIDTVGLVSELESCLQKLSSIKNIKGLYELQSNLPSITGEEENSEALKLLHSNLQKTILQKNAALKAEAVSSLNSLAQAIADPNAHTQENLENWAYIFLTHVNSVVLYQGTPLDLFDSLDEVRKALKQAVDSKPQHKGDFISDFLLEAFVFDNAIHELLLNASNTLTAEKMERLIASFFTLKGRFFQSNFTEENTVYLTSLINKIAEAIEEKRTLLAGTGTEFPNIKKFYAQESQTFPVTQRLQSLEKVTLCMNQLKEKYHKFVVDGAVEARDSADDCWKKMNQLNSEFQRGHITLSTYQDKAATVISKAHEVLDNHRGCKEILINLGIAVFTLVVGYLAIAAYQGRFFPVCPIKTDSEEKLQTMQDAVEAIEGYAMSY